MPKEKTIKVELTEGERDALVSLLHVIESQMNLGDEENSAVSKLEAAK